MNKHDDFPVGRTDCYINDYQATYLCKLPAEAAVAWLKSVAPDVCVGSVGKHPATALTLGDGSDTDALQNGWLNKLWVVVEQTYSKAICLYAADGTFWVCAINFTE